MGVLCKGLAVCPEAGGAGDKTAGCSDGCVLHVLKYGCFSGIFLSVQ